MSRYQIWKIRLFAEFFCGLLKSVKDKLESRLENCFLNLNLGQVDTEVNTLAGMNVKSSVCFLYLHLHLSHCSLNHVIQYDDMDVEDIDNEEDEPDVKMVGNCNDKIS